MKHFKLMKGVLACLLSLALVVTCFGNIGAKATETAAETKTKVTFTYTVGSGNDAVSYKYEKEIPYTSTTTGEEESQTTTYTPGDGKTVTLGDFYNNAKATIGTGENATTKNLKDDYIISALAETDSTFASAGADKDLADATWTLTDTILATEANRTAYAVTVNTVFVPKTINYVFTIPFGGKDYTAKFPVDNLKDNTKKVSFTAAEIIAAAVNGEGDDAKSLADENVVLTKINNTDVDSAEYVFEQAYTAEYKSADVAIGNNVAVSTIEGEIGYDPEKDSVVIKTAVKDVTISYASVKAATGNKVSKFATVKTGEDKTAYIALNNKKAGVSVAENKDTLLCVLVGAVKAEKGKTYDANVTVKGTSYKKLSVGFNYAKADVGVKDLAVASIVATPTSGEAKTYTSASEDWNTVLGFLQYSVDNGATWLKVNGGNTEVLANYKVNSAPDKVKVTIKDYTKLIDGDFTYNADAKDFIKTVKEYTITTKGDVKVTETDAFNVETVGTTKTYEYKAGATEDDDPAWDPVLPTGITADEAEVGDKITITVTDKTYKLSDGATVTIEEDAALTNESIVTLAEVMDDGKLTGEKLYGWTLLKKAPKVLFRLSGSVKVGEVEAYRNTKAAKGSIKKAGNAPKVKVDGVKGTIGVKNGYDYAVLTEEGATPEPDDWTTILPFSKESKNETSTIKTSDFVPTKKFAETAAAYFTSKKIKSLSIDDLFALAKGNAENIPDSIYVFVRKSASDGKPASAASAAVKIDKATAAPSLTALKTDATKYAEAAKSEKGTALTIPAIKNDAADKNTASYEYLIIKAEDFGKVDYSSSKWGKLVAGKALTVDKTKSKYVVGTENKEATLGTDSLILIRRSGDKKKGILPSEVLQTKVIASKMTVDKVEVDSFAWVANS